MLSAERTLARVPSCNGLDLLGGKGRKEQLRMHRLPRQRFRFVQGEAQGMALGCQLRGGLSQNRRFDVADLPKDLLSAGAADARNASRRCRFGPVSVCCQFHNHILSSICNVRDYIYIQKKRTQLPRQTPDAFT